MVILGGWISYVVEKKIYAIGVIYECNHWDHFGILILR